MISATVARNPQPAEASETTSRPLVVDLDGTLLKSDLLVESFSALLATNPLAAIKAALSLSKGKAHLKATLAEQSPVDIATLPWNEDVVRFIQEQRANGRKVYLASASDRRWVDAVAERLGLFDGVFASDGKRNLSSHAKAEVLCEAFGRGNFDYIGNEAADYAVWDCAGQALLADASPSVLRHARKKWPDLHVVSQSKTSLKLYIKEIRVHQWLKNLLIFLPPLAAHHLDIGTLAVTLVAFFSFSFCASSVYVLNDLIDLGRDRSHPTKRFRPFASGRIPILHGLVMTPVLLIAGVASALLVSTSFFIVLAVYYALTLAYSLDLKRRMMLDVVVLACLYGMRLVAGSAAAAVPLSAWLGAFSIFFFLSLALVKRSTELVGRISKGQGDPSGRDYRLQDLPIIEAMSAASGMVAVMIYALYVNSPGVEMLYHFPHRLSLGLVVLVYWIGRVLMLAHRGEMHDDPIVFAATDKVSVVCGVLIAAVVAISL